MKFEIKVQEVFESLSRDLANGALADARKYGIQEFGKESRPDSRCTIWNAREIRFADAECVRMWALHPRMSEPATTQTVPPEVISRLRVSTTALNRAGT